MIVYLFGFNLLETILPSLMSKRTELHTRGFLMGVFSTAQFFGAFFGGLLGGILLKPYGASGALWLACGALLVWFLLSLGMQRIQLKK
jgi:MFS family permease